MTFVFILSPLRLVSLEDFFQKQAVIVKHNRQCVTLPGHLWQCYTNGIISIEQRVLDTNVGK